MLGPVAGRRIDAAIDRFDIDGPWRPLAALGGEPSASLAVVATAGTLCATDDLEAAVALLRRVLVPGGRLLFLEHEGRPGLFGTLQRVSEPVYAAMPGGCHVRHDVHRALRRGGFEVDGLDRLTVPSVVPLLRHWVRGVARSRP
jgi:SAM-dependent methyltransferase